MIEFLCLQCCDCQTFQSQQKRKDKKFTCKVCGKKQSVVKVYGISYKAKDIRGLVMKYNEMRGRGELITQEAQKTPSFDDNELANEYDDAKDNFQEETSGGPTISKWAQFLEDDDGAAQKNDKNEDNDDDDDVVQAFLMKRQRLQEKREKRRQTPYQKRSLNERNIRKDTKNEEQESFRPSNELPKTNLSRFKERAKVSSPLPSIKHNNKSDYNSDEDDEEESGTKKIVVDPNSKWAAFL